MLNYLIHNKLLANNLFSEMKRNELIFVVECTFEETNPPLCGWVNVRGRDRIDWNRATGRTASIGTGPTNDHTYGNSKGRLL